MDCSSSKKIKKYFPENHSLNHRCVDGSLKTTMEYVMKFPLATEQEYAYKVYDDKCTLVLKSQTNDKIMSIYTNKLTTAQAIQTYL